MYMAAVLRGRCSVCSWVQVAQVREAAERRIAQLHSKLQGLESRLHQLAEENRQLAAAAQGPGAPSAQVCIIWPSDE